MKFLISLLFLLPVFGQGTRVPTIPGDNTWSGTNTFTGPVNIRQVGGNWFYADQFPGVDGSVKINACLDAVALVAGGTCDASFMGGSLPQAFSQQIHVGTQGMEASGGTVTLILPVKAQWSWDIRDGTSCGIKQFSSSQIIGVQTGGTWSGVVLIPGTGSTNMDSLYCTDPTPASGAAYIRAEGFVAKNVIGATFASGIIHIGPLYDQSHFTRIVGINYSGDSWHIDNACCGVAFDQIQGYGGGTGVTTAGYPLLIKGGRAFTIKDSTFNGAGTGKSNIKIGGSAGSPEDVTFLNTYMEKYITDNSIPMVVVASDVRNVHFIGGFALTSCSSGCAQVIFENNTSYGFAVDHFGMDFETTSAVHDVANGRSFAGNGVSLDHYAVGPAASNNFWQGLSSDKFSVISPSGNLPVVSGVSTFTPSGTGWYRVISANYGSTGRPAVSGTMEIFGEFGFDNFSSLMVDFRVGAYGAPGIVTARTFGIYGGHYGPIDKIEVSGDGAALLYVDVHIDTITGTSPITIVYYGQGIQASTIIASPVVGATPGGSSVASIDFSTNDGTFSFLTSGEVVGGNLRSNSGGAATKLSCYKADGKTLGWATMVAGDITACN